MIRIPRLTPGGVFFVLLFLEPVIAQPKLAITHVTVINTTGAPIQRNMTVTIASGRIVGVGKSGTVRVARNARVIDASDKFLIPALWDMHAHVGSQYIDHKALLPLFVANGVAGIRVMSGDPEHLLWQRQIESGRMPGPRMVIAYGPLESEARTTEVEARAAVRKAKQDGWGFFRVHDNLPRASYLALMHEARRLGVRVEGHVPQSITVEEVSRAGQRSIEHFTGMSLAETDPDKADVLSGILRQNRTWHCPTLIMRSNYSVLDNGALINEPRLIYAKSS